MRCASNFPRRTSRVWCIGGDGCYSSTNPFVNQVFLFQKGPLAFRRLARELRAAGPWDAILQLRGNDPEPRCLSYLLDPDITVSTPNMTRLSWLCGHNVEQPDWDDTHGVEQTLRLAR